MSDKIKETLEAIRSELIDRAEKKFPLFPIDPIHAAAIVGEKAGELLQAALKVTYEKGQWEDVYDEAIDAAAMALRVLVMFEYLEARPSPQAARGDPR